MSIDPRFMRYGRPVRALEGAATATFFHATPSKRVVLFTNDSYDKDTEWLDDDAFPAITGWRRMHALASMRAMLGTLAFAACGVRHGEQLRNTTSRDPAVRELEWDRANAWAEQVYRQSGIEWCPRCWSREVEKQTTGYPPDSDRNQRTCRACGHKWRPSA
jgi:hypothetical protein